MLRVLEQSAFKERKCTRVFERDHDRHVPLQESEAGFTPLEFLRQVAGERDFAQIICFLLPLLRVGNFHPLAFSPSAEYGRSAAATAHWGVPATWWSSVDRRDPSRP